MNKPIYKKWWFWLIAVFIICAIAIATGQEDPKEQAEPEPSNVAANEDEPNEAVDAPSQSKEVEQQTETGKTESETQQQNNQANNDLVQITKSGGLGDPKSIIEKNYGNDENEPDSGMSAYKNKSLLVMYYDDIAFNVTLYTEGSTKEEALGEANAIMPTDAVKVKEYKADENRDVIQFESEGLANQLKGFYDGQDDLKPGTFIAIVKHDDKGVYAVIIAAGDNP
ncbi:hypothetical protein [Paenibacillus cineris]|uniref:Uncharacterized protein n=1 Tax=Paenibacillus cineris TaxID=237530 RepID=A0ABQ4LN45_9BACL|nr:hypothetical protein [Paenibacillus cineris]GIO57934.1 hypothetical protein J21TS7_62520 [Paenibacillus cineris]